ncbi:beta-1,3-galactosyltransferase 1-like [Diadema antillarum]|uniref:beta-1,3-galactosyltransferase 1-like n=1 Tax=Diadema antillarum TaxID=105358 RepID=UPI003A870E8E
MLFGLTEPTGVERYDLGGNASIAYRKSTWLHLMSLSNIQRAVELWDSRIDLHEFSYLHNPVFKCMDLEPESDILLLIMVNSAPKNSEKRAYIRKTFGNASAWPSHNGRSVMRIVFLLAAVSDRQLQDDVRFESLAFDDIVQESFVDNYLNMTRKTIMGMKWVTTFCRRAKFTMKVDDDVLINVPRVLTILGNARRSNFSYGTVHWAKPVRRTTGNMQKFYTPRHVYPREMYPPYFNGHAYILSTDVVEKVFHVSREIKLFPWSDVYVGMCLEKLGIRLRHSEQFCSVWFRMVNKTTFAESENAVDIIREYVSVFHLSFQQMNQLWDIWNRQL